MRMWMAVVAMVALLMVALAAAGPFVPAAIAAEPARDDAIVSLETRLKQGLQARLPSENAFVDVVVEQVNAGRLPRKLVDTTFLWAVQRGHAYPFPRFERALRLQAARLGLNL